MRIKRVGCFDIGLKCGGWGKIILELKFEDKDKVIKKMERAH